MIYLLSGISFMLIALWMKYTQDRIIRLQVRMNNLEAYNRLNE